MFRDIRSELSAQRATELSLAACKGRKAAAVPRPTHRSPRERVGRRLISLGVSLSGGERVLFVVRCP